MILVIADDYSGACELANAAVHQGFTAMVATNYPSEITTDVLAIDSHTRNCDEGTAIRRLAWMLDLLPLHLLDWIYKKTDSVFRGHPIAEIKLVMSRAGLSSCCFVPANPSRGRIIDQGRYYIDGIPLQQTGFGRDPMHPIATNVVAELVGNHCGIRIPDVTSARDIPCTQGDALAAGGVDFFSKLLGNGGEKPIVVENCHDRMLLVCGSLYAWRQERAQEMRNHRFRVIDLYQELLDSDLDSHRLMLAIGDGDESNGIGRAGNSYMLRLIERAKKYLTKHSAVDIFVGGETARALVDSLHWNCLVAKCGKSASIAHLRGSGLHTLTVKPGSYAWPPELGFDS